MAESRFINSAGRGILICILALSAGAVRGQSFSTPRIRDARIERAYRQLVHAEVFNFGGVGWGRQITAEENAFITLCESTDSIRLFQRLINEANPEGQMYALFGLHLTDPETFRVAADKLRANGGPPQRLEKFIPVEKGKVRIAHGCVISQQDSQTVIDQIAKGEWDAAFRSHRWGSTY